MLAAMFVLVGKVSVNLHQKVVAAELPALFGINLHLLATV